MYEELNRKEKICIRAMRKANKGFWSLEKELVYKSEIAKLEEELGVKVIPQGEISKGLIPVSISWRGAFKGKRHSLEQAEYISGWYSEIPKCKNFAEELAIETLRTLAITD